MFKTFFFVTNASAKQDKEFVTGYHLRPRPEHQPQIKESLITVTPGPP
jgi:hypothetical protein